MRCLRCQNEDERLFGYDHGTWYCRKCVAMSRLDVGQSVCPVSLSHRVWKGRPHLKYDLTDAQKQVFKQALDFLKQEKTEITFESICWYLSLGKKVDFALVDECFVYSFVCKGKGYCDGAFKNRKFQVLVSTTLLERGITVPSVQVIVLSAKHVVFMTASLIQIFGCVGRSF